MTVSIVVKEIEQGNVMKHLNLSTGSGTRTESRIDRGHDVKAGSELVLQNLPEQLSDNNHKTT